MTSRGLSALALVVLGIQAALVAVILPASAIGTTATFWFLDHPIHLYQIEMGRQLLAQGQLIGFDPYFAGGYLGGVSFNQSARIPVLLSFVAGDVDTRTLYAVYLGCSAIAGPAMLVWLAALMRYSVVEALAVATIGMAFWWCSAMRWYGSAGLTAFVLACYFAIPYSVWLWQICARDAARIGALVAAGLVGGIALWFHPLFVILVASVLGGCTIAWGTGGGPWRFLLRATLVAGIGVASSLPWLVAMAQAPALVSGYPYLREVGLKPVFGVELGVPNGLLTPMYLLAFTTCVVGLAWRPRVAQIWRSPFLPAAIALLLFAALGGLLDPIATLQPNRFAAPGFLLLCICGAPACVEIVRRNWRPGLRWRKRAIVGAGLVVALVIGREWVREVASGPHGHYGKGPPEMTETPPSVQRIVDWIAANTTADGRVLFETSNGRVHAKAHVAAQLALMTGREMMGGPYPYLLKRQSFYDHVGFGKPLAELGLDELRRGFDLYNVGWIVSYSGELQRLLAKAPFVREVARFDNVAAYVVERPLSFAARGDARITSRGFDRVEVEAPAGQADVVLRYNWTQRLHACPAARLEPVVVEPDFPAMIRVVDPPPHFVISTREHCDR